MFQELRDGRRSMAGVVVVGTGEDRDAALASRFDKKPAGGRLSL